MSQPTTIEWVLEVARQNGYSGGGHVWNPIKGCSRISPGCQHCYAERIAGRFSDRGPDGAVHDKPLAFEGFAVIHNGEAHWTGSVEIDSDEKLTGPLRRRKPTVYFGSMFDLFHENLRDADIDKVFAVMALARQNLFLILTKRAERMSEYFRDDVAYRQETIGIRAEYISGLDRHWDGPGTTPGYGVTWRLPLPNVWLGVSAENQPYANERVEHLRRTPAAKKFISYEPALEEVRHDLTGIDWLICGAESGPGARHFDLDWARSARDQCVAAGVPFFWKQDAVNGKKLSTPALDGKVWTEVPPVEAKHAG